MARYDPITETATITAIAEDDVSPSSGVATAVGWLRSWLAGRRTVCAASGWLRSCLAARRFELCEPPTAGFAFTARLGFFRAFVREAAAAGRFRTAIVPHRRVRRTRVNQTLGPRWLRNRYERRRMAAI